MSDRPCSPDGRFRDGDVDLRCVVCGFVGALLLLAQRVGPVHGPDGQWPHVPDGPVLVLAIQSLGSLKSKSDFLVDGSVDSLGRFEAFVHHALDKCGVSSIYFIYS